MARPSEGNLARKSIDAPATAPESVERRRQREIVEYAEELAGVATKGWGYIGDLAKDAGFFIDRLDDNERTTLRRELKKMGLEVSQGLELVKKL